MSFLANSRILSAKDSDRTGRQSRSPIVCITINNSGTRVINTRLDRSIRIWKSSLSGLSDPVIIDNAHSEPVSCISWVPTTDYNFASAGGDSVVKIWRANGSLERDISVGGAGDTRKCKLVSFSPDGAIMLAVTTSGIIYAYDVLDNYSLITQFNLAESNGEGTVESTTNKDEITDIQWTNRGHSYFFVGLSTGPILIINLEDRRLTLVHLLLGCRSVTCLLVDLRGKFIAAGSKDGVVSFWRTSDMTNCRALTSVDQEISSLSSSRDGSLICVGYSSGSNSRVFDSDTLEERKEIPNSTAGEDSKSVVACYPTKSVLVYSSEKGDLLSYIRRDERAPDDRKRR
ncbi:hypothetical protein JCM33374_g4452 [Metschnikowia sp. JCM 33374]|nr:hypothetical protein JCM33374_g4452 [Metschnikowia sp. JCM 33374]